MLYSRKPRAGTLRNHPCNFERPARARWLGSALALAWMACRVSAAVVSSFEQIPSGTATPERMDIVDASADGNLITGVGGGGHGFVWGPGQAQLTFFPDLPRGRYYSLYGLSPSGAYGGGYDPFYGAVRRESDGTFTRLAAPPQSASYAQIGGLGALDAADDGTVVGTFPFLPANAQFARARPVVWSSPSTPTELPLPAGWVGNGVATHISADATRIFGVAAPPMGILDDGYTHDYKDLNAAGVVRWINGAPQKWVTFPARSSIRRLCISADGSVCAGVIGPAGYVNSGVFRSFFRVGDTPARMSTTFLINTMESGGRLMAGTIGTFEQGRVQAIPGTGYAHYGSVYFINRVGGIRPLAELAFSTGLTFWIGNNVNEEFQVVAQGTPSALVLAGYTCRVVLTYEALSSPVEDWNQVLTVPNPLPPEPAPIAEPGTLFVRTKTVRPAVHFSESYLETPKITSDGNLTKTVKGTWTVTMKGALSAKSAAAVVADTEVGFSLGRFEFHRRLGDDPKWISTRKTARWVVNQVIAGKTVAILTVTCARNAKSVTLIARCTDSVSYPLAWPDHSGWEGPVEQTLTATLHFGAETGAAYLNAKGAAIRRFVETTPGSSIYFDTRSDGLTLSGKLKL